MNLIDICITVIILLVGFNLKYAFRDFTRKDRKFLTKLFFYHLVITVAFHFFISLNGGDANYYWSYPKTASLDDIFDVIQRGSASGIIYLINYIPSKLLELSFFTGNMLYSLLGYVGFIYLYRITKNLFGDFSEISNYKIFGISVHPWIWFLPNLHFWSSGIGKDVILFYCIALFVYSLQNVRKHLLGIVVSMLLSLMIRPHITLFLLVSFGLGYTLDTRLKAYKKTLVFIIFVVGFVSIFNYVMDFVRLESLEFKAIEEYTSTKAASLNQEDASSGLDTSGYPLPIKIFTFLYRPFFFDINGILAILASVENLTLLVFTFAVIKKNIFRGFIKANYLVKGLLIYFIIGTIAFSLILGNLGIMLRQKNMFFPLFIIFGMWIFYYHRNQKIGHTP